MQVAPWVERTGAARAITPGPFTRTRGYSGLTATLSGKTTQSGFELNPSGFGSNLGNFSPKEVVVQTAIVCIRTLQSKRFQRCHPALTEAGGSASPRPRLQVLPQAREAEPYLRSVEQTTWLQTLEAEHDNLRAALFRSLSTGQGEIAGRLAGALWQFWATHSHFSEGRKILGTALEHSSTLPMPVRAKVLFGAAELTRHQGEYERASAHAAYRPRIHEAEDHDGSSMSYQWAKQKHIQWKVSMPGCAPRLSRLARSRRCSGCLLSGAAASGAALCLP